MSHYVARRILQAVPLIAGVIVLNFVLVRLAPGDPTTFLVGEFGATAEDIATVRERFGLDRSPTEQLIRYVKSVLRGDLGYSFYYSQPVLGLVLERVPATLLLMGSQLVLASGLGILLGLWAGRNRHTLVDNLVSAASVAGFSVPVFWSAQMLLLLFAIKLRLFPAQGMVDVRGDYTGFAHAVDIIRHLALPAVTLAVVNAAFFARVTRAAVIEVTGQTFVVTARAKGLTEATVLFRHILRNALLPVVTVLGVYLGHMLAGAALTETVFSWPGVGRLMYDAILRRDFPVILGVLLVTSVGVILASLFTDLAYAAIDPRIRLGKRES